MLAILSPAKSLDFESKLKTKKATTPDFVDQSSQLIKRLRRLTPAQIGSLMKISDNLADLNHRRYAEWDDNLSATDPSHTRQAILAFKGDVYIGLDSPTMNERDFTWAQKHLRILSGLHGLLRPLDRIHPYRLEMGSRLDTPKGKNLYEFWGTSVTDALNEAIAAQGQKVLINLASNEYYRVLQTQQIDARIINVSFREWKNGQYKFLSFFAKKARGSMARYMIDTRASSVKGLQGFNYDGYAYNTELSDGDDWVFTRKSI